MGLETTLKRPIINTRDEPHADARLYRRLHVITETPTCRSWPPSSKWGPPPSCWPWWRTTFLPREFRFRTPVAAMRQVSYDLSLDKTLELADGTTATALEIQWDLLDQARKYADSHGLDAVGGPVGRHGDRPLGAGLGRFGGRPPDPGPPTRLGGQIPAHTGIGPAPRPAARRCPPGRARHPVPRLAAPSGSVAARVGLETLVPLEDARTAISEPPTDTRAYFRGQCLKRWAPSIVAANWDSIVFDLGDEPLRRVPMMEPRQGHGRPRPQPSGRLRHRR